MSEIEARLIKNFKKKSALAKKYNVTAWRLYDWDIPEFPFYIDIYNDHYVVFSKTNPAIPRDQLHLEKGIQAIQTAFQAAKEKIIVKHRERQKGESQYERLQRSEQFLVVQEGPAQFSVNLWDYLDTGLFLDHRPLRNKVYQEAEGRNFLNLFCYTGAFSVFAALGGAKTTSVDMSKNYLEWTRKNFELNKISLESHRWIEANALEFLHGPVFEQFDLIFLDPPTFSNSKKMDQNFEVERDQIDLVTSTMKFLKPKGKLYFSNNKQGFKLDPFLKQTFQIEDITAKTIPFDFHQAKPHVCFSVTEKNDGVEVAHRL